MANDISKIKLPGSTTEYTVKDSSAITNITRSGTTFTATKRDGTTFTFTQQDNNTTYTLSVGTGDDASKIVLTPSSGTANKITVPYATSAGSATDSTKLPLAGGTMTGAITFANGIKNVVGDDSAIGDCNIAGTLGLIGVNGATGLAFFLKDTTWGSGGNYAKFSYDGTSMSLNKPFNIQGTNASWLATGQSPTVYVKKSSGSGALGAYSVDTRTGRFVLSTYPSSDDLVYFNWFSDTTLAGTTNTVDKQFTWTPSTNTLSTNISGTAAIANKLGSSNVGSATQPIYLSAGTATACTYTLGKSVPSDAVFTDKNVSISSVDGGHDFYLTLSNTLNPSNPSYIYTNNGLKYYPTNGTTTNNGYAALYLGNSTPSGTAGNQTGQIVLYSDGAGAATLKAATTNTTPATPCYLPTTGGTLTVMSGAAAGTNVVLSGEVDGLLVKSSYTIGKSVPSNAKFTDTTYGISNSGESITLTAGGTGTSVSLSTLINGLSVGTSTPNDNDYYISQYVGGGTTTTSYHRRPMSALYTYIKDKLQAGSLAVTDVLGIQQTAGTSGGISLYGGTGSVDNYGIAFRTTANKGKHGYVQSDWATYFTMNDNATRGWIFRRNGSGNVASISCEGHLVLNGSLTVGGNTTNTSGARIVYNSTNQAIDFVFVA